MSNFPADADPVAWQRTFAIEANNRAWDLSVGQRTVDDDSEMLTAAHAAAYHWAAVGDELNVMRATMLLAEVHALLGHGETALGYASTMADYFRSREADDWEIALTHAIMAHASATAGDAAGHQAAYQEAVAAIGAVSDPDDRKIVEATFVHVPEPTG